MGRIKLFLGASILLLVSGQISAELVEQDLYLANDGLITLDTNTGLEWLDVNVTFGLNYHQAQETTFVTSDGFRHATVTEVVNIFSEFGVTDFSGSRVTENWPGARNLIDTMGPGYNAGNFDVLNGWAELEPFDPDSAIFINVDATFEGNGPDNSRARMDDIRPKDYTDNNDQFRGHWLVRPHISTITIDIKPGSDPNCFNINSHGVIPVAILGSDSFDVTEIAQDSLSFGGLEVRVRGNKGPQCQVDYSDGDEYLDLVCQFEDNSDYWSPGEGEATLTGSLIFRGGDFEGTDSICVVP